jgi:hypothetical protein
MQRQRQRPYFHFLLEYQLELLTIIKNELASDNDKTLAALASCRIASRVLYSHDSFLFFIHTIDGYYKSHPI